MKEKPRIVFLDASTMDAGDIDFSPLRQFGTFILHKTTDHNQTLERIAEADIVITNKVILDREILQQASSLSMITVCATGVNNIDLDAAKENGITVTNVAGYSTSSVAQHTLSLLLNLSGNSHRYSQEASLWAESPIFTRLTYPMVELSGKTLGIAGAGNIGCLVGETLKALGMDIQVLARKGSLTDRHPEWPRVDHDRFFSSSDAISLHCPLTESTRHMISSKSLELMKPAAFIVNTGRGELIDEPALIEALQSGCIAGAALDVISQEPPRPDHPLLEGNIPNLIITPHSAWTSIDARNRLLDGIINNLRTFIAGNPENRVI
ncbi:MAG: D-2-hydroxyacid dehydrogenase [Verrucomicrobiales bacterium]|nr:D-2-hydroxyacid dehydrogenase [Verrucomicrobiales bacterium]